MQMLHNYYKLQIANQCVIFSFYLNLCMNVFGEKFTAEYIYNSAKSTSSQYGGKTNFKVICLTPRNSRFLRKAGVQRPLCTN